MKTNYWAIGLLLTSILPALAAKPVVPPAPYGPAPTVRQLRWHELERYAFIHFGVDTFTDREWGFGDEKPALFNPTAFDANQIAAAAKAGGMNGLIFVAKHHDGLCLWPTKSTTHNITATRWRKTTPSSRKSAWWNNLCQILHSP